MKDRKVKPAKKTWKQPSLDKLDIKKTADNKHKASTEALGEKNALSAS